VAEPMKEKFCTFVGHNLPPSPIRGDTPRGSSPCMADAHVCKSITLLFIGTI